MTDAPKTIWPYHWHRYDTKNGDGKGQVEYTLTDIAQAELAALQAENAKLREALQGMVEHVPGEEFCLCEYKEHTEPADTGDAVETARTALSAYRNVKGENDAG